MEDAVKVQLSGGLELIFDKQKEISVSLGEDKTIRGLVLEMKKLIKERPEFFLTNEDEVCFRKQSPWDSSLDQRHRLGNL